MEFEILMLVRNLFTALLNPRQFGLVTETPSNAATRSLIMIAKCLQNLANLVEFGGKVRKLYPLQMFQMLIFWFC